MRNLKSKDQNIQESSVKIELMERRMETVKKHADTINGLEAELGKARKQEKSYEEAIDELQRDLDALEQDNIKLKALANNPERQGWGSLLSSSISKVTYVLQLQPLNLQMGRHCRSKETLKLPTYWSR